MSRFEGHTPGPWGVSATTPSLVEADVLEGRCIAQAIDPIPNIGLDAMRANARLIAAAPDLLRENEELREALREIAKGEGPFSRDQLQHCSGTIESMKSIALAAIAKLDPAPISESPDGEHYLTAPDGTARRIDTDDWNRSFGSDDGDEEADDE